MSSSQNDTGKILVYMQTSELAPVGGPRGYLYNLKQMLDRLPESNVFFIESKIRTNIKRRNIIDLIGISKKKVILILKSTIKYFMVLYGPRHKALVELNQYDAVHFHTALDMYKARESLKKYNGIVLFTSHSPTLSSSEIYDTRTTFEKKYFGFIFNNLIRIDEYAFRRADYLIFPCPEAEEPYYNHWADYKKIKEIKEDKFRYVLTGIKQCVAKMSREDVRNRFNIPNDAFVICYVGRHSEIKGYDVLREIGKVLLEYKNVYFLVAGKEEPLKGLHHERWIEVGWTSDPHSLVASSDVFVLPNRETYFDLVMLEVLSLGQIVVASRTGGNKFFEEQHCDGVMLYETEAEAVDILKELMKSSERERLTRKTSNLELFYRLFTLEKFADQYIKLYSDLLTEESR